MKLAILVFTSDSMLGILRRDAVVAKECDLEDGFAVNPESRVFRRALAIGAKHLAPLGRGFSLRAHVEFSPAESRQAQFLEVLPRKLLKLTIEDFELFVAELERTPLADHGAWDGIKLLRRVWMTRVRVGPMEMLRVDDAVDEYIVGERVQQIIECSGMEGAEFLPVRSPRNSTTWNGIAQLFTASVLPLALRDPSIVEVRESLTGSRWLRAVACFTYTAQGLLSARDFNRTAEPWESNGLPSWIVSRKVLDCFSAEGVKGLRFKPVLVEGTPLQQEYARVWGVVAATVAEFPCHHF